MLRRYVYISDDNLTLSNVITEEAQNNCDNNCLLENFRGGMADICVTEGERIYYEVEVGAKIVEEHFETYDWLVLELGLAEPDKLDQNYDLFDHGWNLQVYNDKELNGVIMEAICPDQNVNFKTEKISGNSIGTEISESLGVFVDRLTNKVTFSIGHSNVYTFESVISNFDLCPTFGIYSVSKVHVRIRISEAKNFTSYPALMPVKINQLRN